MMPIEPGCRAIITSGEYRGENLSGVEVVCHEEVVRSEFHGCPVWRIDRLATWYSPLHGVVDLPCAPERFLMRIDGYDEQTEDQHEHSKEETA